MSEVKRLLVTGTEDQLASFHAQVCFRLNGLERREDTVIYTCMVEDLELALSVAWRYGLTIEEIVGSGGDETYKLLGGDGTKGWGALTGRVSP